MGMWVSCEWGCEWVVEASVSGWWGCEWVVEASVSGWWWSGCEWASVSGWWWSGVSGRWSGWR